MKFWQLVSIVGGDLDYIVRVSEKQPYWKAYSLLAHRFNDLVTAQDREALDQLLDVGFVEAVLGNVKIPFYLSSDYWLRTSRFEPGDQEISASDAFRSYGGNALEEACESGSVQVPPAG